MDLSTLTVADLKKLQVSVDKELVHRQQFEKVRLLDEVKALAKAHGYTLEDLIKNPGTGKVKGTVAPKYRNPNNGDITWSGRGRKPQWVLDWLASGKDISGLEIA